MNAPLSERVLVTGGSGYIAQYCITQLLERGYSVRTTIRNVAREPEVRAALALDEAANARLTFTAADLENDAGWNDAVRGCAYVLHVASPLPATLPKSDDELVVPAREGTLRVLRAAKEAGVRRVVLTSSTAAVTYGVGARAAKGRVFTEEDWTDPSSADTSPYVRSKVLAERAAWDFVKEHGGPELAVINPGAVLGPVKGKDFSSSIEIVKKLLDGSVPGLPRLGFPLVDVRDLADLHVRAMTSPDAAGQRFLAAGEFLWFHDVSAILRDRLGARARKAPTLKLPDLVVRLFGVFDKVLGSVLFELGVERRVSSAKAERLLGWTRRPAEDSIVATAESLFAQGIVRA